MKLKRKYGEVYRNVVQERKKILSAHRIASSGGGLTSILKDAASTISRNVNGKRSEVEERQKSFHTSVALTERESRGSLTRF
jgi:hypothetical protein